MLDLNLCFSQFKSILCLNGQVPAKDLFLTGLPLIATDGAANKLLAMTIMPDLIVGDLDSLKLVASLSKTEIIQITEQDTTDCQKALALIKARELFPCLVYGATGQETDHTLCNLNALAHYANEELIIFHDSAYSTKQKYGLFLNSQLTAQLPLGNKISILTLSTAMVSSYGLVWELEEMRLTPAMHSGRNLVKSSPLQLYVHQGQALVMFDYN